MNLGDLREIIKDLPDSVEVYVQADGGTVSEDACWSMFSTTPLLWLNNRISWFDDVERQSDGKPITAICIGS